ncbi:methyl-accepting chemotaxis protein McpB [Tissierella creatinophila DSM 6911]|uniref:Methyl-accepting chemotaxis protein McpB n=2 Tax=Tissierella creatinophila TaxID=79681 RepID=A0A1U7M4X3_TISCR|nr:methyl-accepting chemotaxis protein McpB [Tissierella creatinophila DSM 6911]
MRFGVRNKMFISFGLIVLLIISFGVYSLNVIKSLKDISNEIIEHSFKGIDLSHKIKTDIAEFRGGQYRHISFEDLNLMKEVEQELNDKKEELKKFINEYKKTLETKQSKKLIGDLDKDIDEYLDLSSEVLRLSIINEDEKATELMLKDSLKEYIEIMDKSDNLIVYNGKIVEEGYREIGNKFRTSRFISLIFLLIIIFISIALAVVLSNNINKRLLMMKKSLNRSKDLDLSVDKETLENFRKFKSKDEITDAGISYISMTKNLREIVIDIKGAVSNVDEHAKDVAQNIEEVTSTFEGITEATEELAKGAGTQANDAEEAVYKLNQLSQNVEGAVDNSKVVEEGVKEIVSANKEGQIAIENLKEIGVKNIEALGEVVSQIDILDRESSSIAGITDTIKEIANQTNLLALNAMIEAARAGEDGKGFAVVATEIRKLAEQVEDNIENIENTINGINGEINKTKKMMEDAGGVIGESQKATDMTEEKFIVIANSITTIVDRIDDLLKNIDDIDKDKEKVAASIQNISAVTEESSAATQEISASLQEQSAIMEEILNAAKEVETVARDTNEILDRFTI